MTVDEQPDLLGDFFPAKRKHVNYLVNWAVDRNIIYVETPKVGCTVIKRVLQYAEANYDLSRLPHDVHDKCKSPLRSPKFDINRFISGLTTDECYCFSFVRNPITRTLSAYLDKIVGEPGVVTLRQERMGIDPAVYVPTFEEFVDIVYNEDIEEMDVHWAPQTFLLGYSKVRYDYIGRFEFFQPSLDALVSRLDLRYPEGVMSQGRRHATNADGIVSKYYTPKILRRIHEIYHEDFLHLGYGWSI